MMRVVIIVNGEPIYARTGTNIGDVGKDCKYMVDDGRIILHNPDDGLIKLAIKLLESIKEV